PTAGARRLAWIVVGLVAAQWAVGLVNVLLLVPLWTQLVHLLLADFTWIALLLWGAETLARRPATAPSPGAARPAAVSAD
ncbi:MAG: hypothetical protein JNK29_01655, partial [Anaerolineales bacterium]|nr:hypothetical protein [Anaerolineales bacterium]